MKALTFAPSMRRLLSLVVLCVAATLGLVPAALAQTLIPITFRFLPDLQTPAIAPVAAAFVPGGFNSWGQPYVSGTNGGRIAAGNASQMTYESGLNEYRKTVSLGVGYDYEYKLQYHKDTNPASTNFVWTTDPANPLTSSGGNSIARITDPMVFQLMREQEGTSSIVAVSAGLFGSAAVQTIAFEVNGVVRDGLPHFDAATRIFRYALPAPVPVGSQFKVTVTDVQGRTATASIGTPPPTVVDAPRPAGLREGATRNADGSITFCLFAPHKQYVYVIGGFNGFQPVAAGQMKRDRVDDNNVWWWVTIPNPGAGEVSYQYLIDGQLRVADPYAEKVVFEGDNGFNFGYPLSSGYPVGNTTQPVSVFGSSEPAYVWQTTGWTRPKAQDLVIYELHLRDFLANHSLASLADTLTYLQRLGVTAIELMPLNEYDGNESWGYNPAFHGALDKYYGTKNQLKRLVDMAHARGIAVILDVVYNHATGQSPLVRMWNDSPTGDPSGLPTAQNPYANRSATHPFSVFNDLNHDSPATRRWLDAMNRYWLEEYRLDGFRFDLSKGFTQRNCGGDIGCWNAYDASRVYNLQRMADAVWGHTPDALLILEHLSDDSEEKALHTYRVNEGRPGFLFWTKMEAPFNQATMGFGNNSTLNGAYFGTGGRGFSAPNSVAILEDHDEQRLMRKNVLYGNAAGSYSVKDLNTAISRMGTAGAFFFAMPGPKMIWQFGELGYGSLPDECLGEQDTCTGGRTDRRATRWNYYNEAPRRALYNRWSAQMRLRRAQPIFTDPATSVDVSTLWGATKRLRLSRGGLNAVVLGNFDVAAQPMTAAFHGTGTWYEFYTGQMLTVTDVNMSLTLAPGEYRLYTSQYVGTASSIVAAEPIENAPVPSVLELSVAGANPFASTTRLRYGVPEVGTVRIEVFDLVGRRVATLVDQEQTPGQYTVALDGADLGAGVYLVRLSAGGQVRTLSLTRAR